MRKRLAKKILKDIALQNVPIRYHKYQIFNAFNRVGKEGWCHIVALTYLSLRNQIDAKWDWKTHI